jgi:hypothetical protein
LNNIVAPESYEEILSRLEWWWCALTKVATSQDCCIGADNDLNTLYNNLFKDQVLTRTIKDPMA